MGIIDTIRSECDDKMAKSIDRLRKDLSRIRTGRATPALLDGIVVDYYGSPMPINQVASISTPDPRTIAVQPWEKTMVGVVEKALLASDLGLNPMSDGTILRLPIPALSEERRHELVKNCKKIGEDKKVAIRNVRRESNDMIKKAEKDKEITQDEQKKVMDEIQKLTDKYIKAVDDQLVLKENEIMDV